MKINRICVCAKENSNEIKKIRIKLINLEIETFTSNLKETRRLVKMGKKVGNVIEII